MTNDDISFHRQGESALASRTELLDIIAAAHRLGYNRKLERLWAMTNLDPDGTNVLTIMLEHRHANGIPVAPHARCSLKAKLRNRLEPHEDIIDVPYQLFDKLRKPVHDPVADKWVDPDREVDLALKAWGFGKSGGS